MDMTSSNFREISMGNIAPKILYRSNHPICGREQVEDVILSASNARIKTILNLVDSNQSLQWKTLTCPWYKKIFDSGNVLALNISMSFSGTDKKFCKKLKDGMEFMTCHEPPYLIHCEAGIDRTGFLAIILEAFMGAKFDDIEKDYMLSFVDNGEYSADDRKNGTFFVKRLFELIKGEPIGNDEDLQKLAVQFLTDCKYISLGSGELKILEHKLKGL
jgi:protein tyrosine/serine phosphatase